MIREVAFKPETTLDKICLLHAWVAMFMPGMVIEALDWQFRFHQLIFLRHGQTVSMHPIAAGDFSKPVHSTCKWAMATGLR